MTPPLPSLIPCLADPEYFALYPFMASVSAPLSFVTLRGIMDTVLETFGVEPDTPRYNTFVGAYGIQFVELDIDGELLDVAIATNINEAFWQRYSFPPPAPRDCPCLARYPWPVRPLYPPPPCR